MTKQHEFPSRPPFDLDLDGGRTCRGYADDEPEVDDAAARLRIVKRKAALLMARSGLGDAFFPAGQQQWLHVPSVRVLTRWPMICVFFMYKSGQDTREFQDTVSLGAAQVSTESVETTTKREIYQMTSEENELENESPLLRMVVTGCANGEEVIGQSMPIKIARRYPLNLVDDRRGCGRTLESPPAF